MSKKKQKPLPPGKWLLELYDGYDGSSYYFDELGSFITSVHANDGNWRAEYFDPILKHFGVQGTISYSYKERPDLLAVAKARCPWDFEDEEIEEE
jgi:hypothetical protein